MHYYVITNPHYALIRANNQEEAAAAFAEVTTEPQPPQENLEEVRSEVALLAYDRAGTQEGSRESIESTLQDFEADYPEVLLISGDFV